MPTIKDIAKAAGVSHGTVSNVLNKKGNVSAKKVELVERIALEMGYNINTSAKLLRSGESNSIAIVIPDNEIRRFRDLYKNISRYMEDQGYSSNLYITEGVPQKEKDIIRSVLSDRVHTIVVISCLDKKNDFYTTLNFRQTNIIFVERSMNSGQNKSFFFSYNANKIGRNIAKYIQSKNHKRIIYFSSRKIYSFNHDIFLALTSELTNTDVSINQYSCDTRLNIQTAFKIVFSESNYDLIITTSKEKAKIIKDIMTLSKINADTEIITLASTDIIKSNEFIEYELNYKRLGTKIGKAILSGLDKQQICIDPPELITAAPIHLHKAKPVNIACIKGPSEVALRHVVQLIHASTGIETRIESYSYEELYDKVNQNNLDDRFDLVRFDMAWLSSFGEQMFMPLSDIKYDFTHIFDTFVKGLEDQYTSINGVPYAFPFDPSMLLLFYRKDLFEDSILSRQYYERYKCELTPPTDYQSYNRIASFFTRSFNPESPTMYGTTIAIDAALSIACQFLPIYYQMGGELSHDQLLHLNYDILRRAIENQLETLNYTHGVRKTFWGDAMRQFASGDAAMSITFSNRTSNVINSKVSNVLGKFDFQTLPGEKQIIGGGVLGITKKSKNIMTTCQFLEHFYSKRIALIFACLCGASGSKYVYENEDIAHIYPWMKLVQKNLKGGRRRISMGDYNELDFEYNLGTALQKLYNNEYTIDECIYHISNLKGQNNS